jgi:hypothetical protein
VAAFATHGNLAVFLYTCFRLARSDHEGGKRFFSAAILYRTLNNFPSPEGEKSAKQVIRDQMFFAAASMVIGVGV